MIKDLIKILEILFNVLFNRGLKNFFYELTDILFIDLKFNSKTYLRKNYNNLNYVPYYACVLKKNLKISFSKQKLDQSYFIDLGSGKGRILLSLTNINFLKIIGIEKNKDLFNESKAYILKNKLQNKIEILNNDFFKFRYNFKKNSQLIFFFFFSSSKKDLKKIIEKFRHKFQRNKIFFYIIPSNDCPENLKYLRIQKQFNDFDTDKSRNSKLIVLK